jgi:glycosyltransferase involved in cell wall biosynthesis
MNKIFIVIPVYNEAENIRECLSRIENEVKYPHTIGIVYDNESDTTLPVVKEILETDENLPVILIENKYGRGALNAIKTGLESSGEKYTVVTMADLSDPPCVINDMYEKAEKENADVVCASRYMKGGSQKGGPFIKSLMSRLAGVSLHFLARVPTYDSTNSFKLYRTSFLKKQIIESSGGFELGLELVAKAYVQKAKICEVPTTWTDRAAGKSNFKVAAWMPKYLKWYFYAFKGLFINHKKTMLCLAAAVLAMPALRCFLFVQQFGVNFLRSDEWDLINLFNGVKEQGLQISLLFSQHNEHRMFFPNLLFLLNLFLFDYDSKIMTYVSYVFLLSGAIVILKYIKDIRQSFLFKFIASLLVSVICFNLAQIENLLWGFQTGWCLIFFCIVISAFLFHKALSTEKNVYFAASIIFAVIASFSSAQGLFLWPSFIAVFILMLISREKFNLKNFLFVILVAAAVFLLYFYGYDKPSYHSYKIADITNYLRFYVSVFQTAIDMENDFGMGVFSAVFTVFFTFFSVFSIIYLIYKRKVKENVFPVMLTFSGAIFITVITFTRVNYGFTSRYVTFASLCYIGLILIAYGNILNDLLKRYAAITMMFFILLFELNQPFLWKAGSFLCADRLLEAHIIKNYKSYENISGRIIGHWMSKEELLWRISLLEKNKWSLFSDGETRKNYEELLQDADVSKNITTITEQKNDDK